MVGEYRPQAHRTGMKYSFMTQATQTSMTMHNSDLLSNNDVAKDREEGENSREGRLSVNDEEWDMIHLQSVGKVSNTATALVCMRNDDYLMTPVNEFCR